jgi:hypothetical protein
LKNLKRKYAHHESTLIPVTKAHGVASDKQNSVSMPSPFSLDESSQGYQQQQPQPIGPEEKSPIVAADRPHCVPMPSPFSLDESSQGYQQPIGHDKETHFVPNEFRHFGWSTALSQLVICDSLSPTTSPNSYTLSSGTTRLFADILSTTGDVNWVC